MTPRSDRAPTVAGLQQLGTIIAVSSENTSDPLAWRQSGLAAAAKYTRLEVTIAPHRKPSVKATKALQREGEEPHAKDYPALAWFAHLDALEDFVDSPYETALVVEDDVDWDVAVRETLAASSPVVSAIRNVNESKLDSKQYPYGLNHPGGTSSGSDTAATNTSQTQPTSPSQTPPSSNPAACAPFSAKASTERTPRS
ncbi:MAG: hypothetical protein MMC23_003762 [Stictis urceolatum]|nr:hypothetical protein [Stictis urceolata]